MPWRGFPGNTGRDRANAPDSRARTSSIRVAPIQPPSQEAEACDPARHSDSSSGKKNSQLHGPNIVPVQRRRRVPTKERFLRVFGVLGVPLVLVVSISALWTAWLVVLNIAPNATANFLMSTGDFDDGAFWLIIDPDPALLAMTCLGLAAVLLGYLRTLAAMLLLTVRPTPTPQAQGIMSRLSSVVFGERVVSTWGTLTGFNGTHRKFWNVWLKLLDLTLQIITLHQILEDGLPTVLCYVFATLTAANCFSCGFMILVHTRLSAFTEVLIDTVFDMVFAVGAPIILLVYSYHSFRFDRANAHLMTELTSPGSFERHARMLADPVQVTLFLISFNGLRIRSVLSFFLRIGMNLSFAYRLKRIAEVTAQKAARNARQLSSQSLPRAVEQKAVPKWVAVSFFALGCALLVYTRLCVQIAATACATFSQCAAHVHRVSANRDRCPCIVMIDTDRAPTTYAEWKNPPDVTETLRALALSGDLQVLEVTNRRLRALPDEFRRCSRLRHISLTHTGIQEIPDWAKDFEYLEFLNVEGRADDANLVRIPDDLFANMALLTYFHLGMHPSLQQLPSFQGTRHLKTASFAILLSLEELPSLAPLQHLENLDLIVVKNVRTLPELAGMSKLRHFVTLNTAACCNGELAPCNSTSSMCAGGAECAATTTAEGELLASGAALRGVVTERFPHSVCAVEMDVQGMLKLPSRAIVDVCGGVQFRECAGGMCYSERLQVIACAANEAAIAVRRAQITRGVGPACDPTEERWLGCA